MDALQVQTGAVPHSAMVIFTFHLITHMYDILIRHAWYTASNAKTDRFKRVIKLFWTIPT